MMEWSRSALKIAKDYTVANLELATRFAAFPSNHLSILRDDGAMDLYHGNMRAIDAEGNKIFDNADYNKYNDYIAEEVRPWSYMKFPFIKSIGPEDGWYRVGPLARINACDFIDTPEAEAARKEFMAVTNNKPNNLSLAFHWARLIELLHSMEKIRDLLHDTDLQGEDLVLKGERRNVGVGLLEAPRGTLFHHYEVNDDDQVVMANLIVSTTSNNEPMNRAVKSIADEFISGQPEITEGLLNHVEVGIRCYDPCLSCATHAIGQMPLELSLVDAEGKEIDRKTT